MKKSILLIFLIISGFLCNAQLQVKEGSFKKVDGFVNINIDKMYDDNDKPYAVLKIRTENINDKQRRELGFGGDAQTFFEVEYKDGEVWLYISYYASFIKISHPDLSSTEFWFPYDMEPKRGYELTLVNKPSIDEEVLRRIERLENASTEAQGKGTQTVNVDLQQEKPTNKYREQAYVITPEIGFGAFGFHENYYYRTFLLQLNFEYMATPNFGLGIGAGYVYVNYSPIITAISCYGQASYYFLNRQTSPFINIKIGYSAGLSQNSSIYDKTYSLEGLQGLATLGVNIKQNKIGAVIGAYQVNIASENVLHGYIGVSYSYLIHYEKK